VPEPNLPADAGIRRRLGLVLDACALIDLLDQDRRLLVLIVANVAPVIVPKPVLDEITSLSPADAVRIGLTIHEPLDSELEAASGRRGTLSFEDQLCLNVARNQGLDCVTSDRGLTDACRSVGVPTWSGLRPLLVLAELGILSTAECRVIVGEMSARNAYLTTDVVRRFRTELRAVDRRRRLPR
jgi:rRNA-processing protein FCF1